ncbi:hypothetical protein K9L63_03250 [Candidatus Gracilibacteria bacterium]|nr:hypothetical protein [Candidatus Gracilibacteria bacterium]
MIFAPFFGPLVGGLLFFKLFSKFLKNSVIRKNLWEYTLSYSLVLMVVIELYHVVFEPLWQNLGFIVFVPNGIVLAIIAYLKSKNKS